MLKLKAKIKLTFFFIETQKNENYLGFLIYLFFEVSFCEKKFTFFQKL